MFGIGGTEFLLILLVALIALGPKSLVGVSRKLGRALAEFRKISTDFQRTLNMEAWREEERERARNRQQTSRQTAHVAPGEASSNPFDQAAAKDVTQTIQQNSIQNSGIEETGQNTAKADATPESGVINQFPADSPIAKAIAKAAEKASSGEKSANG